MMGGRPHWAALEAQERRPLEFVIGIDKNGYPVSVGKRGTSILHHVQGGALSSEAHIVAIESKPVKVTREMLSNFNAILNEGVGGAVRWTHGYKSLVRAIKSLGIDAIQEPSNE